MANQEKLDILDEAAVDVLIEVMNNREPSKADLARARIASATRSNTTKAEASLRSRERLWLGMAVHLSRSPEELAHYISVTSPDAPLVKALPPGGDGGEHEESC